MGDARRPGDHLSSPFASRWVGSPASLSLAEPSQLPGGFVAGAVSAGVKEPGRLDVGVLQCLAPLVASAARFCDSGILAAPVLLCQSECDLTRIRAVVANSGNANAATGEAGLTQARHVQTGAAAALGLEPREVAVASTGVIGVQLPGERIAESLMGIAPTLDPNGAASFAAAIKTTDRIDKHACVTLALPTGSVTLAAQCKGAGMISPRFATMLCFVETDAGLDSALADRLLARAVKRSFERISVDGQLSTNDTAILLASGASGVEIAAGSAEEAAFAQALETLLLALAILMVKDGEGARRVGRVEVSGADQEETELVARQIANSPLVKAALFGGDPNWGRIAQAAGGALSGRRLELDITIEGVAVCAQGAAVAFDPEALARAVAREEVEYAVALGGEGARSEVYFSDLSYEYVKINAEYTT